MTPLKFFSLIKKEVIGGVSINRVSQFEIKTKIVEAIL